MIDDMEALPWYMTGLFAVLLFSAFVKILTTLSIVRYGMGLHGVGFGVVILGLALMLSLVVMPEEIQREAGIKSMLTGGPPPAQSAVLEAQYRTFMEHHTDERVLNRVVSAAERLKKKVEAPADQASADMVKPFPVVAAAFLVSEITRAFSIALLVIVPFIIIDLLVVNLLMALGIQQMSQAVVALPLKLLLFVSVDGWTLLTEKLLRGYVIG